MKPIRFYSHGIAFFRTGTADAGTFAAMLAVVFLTFLGAALAEIGAQMTNIQHFVASQSHHFGCCITHGGTLHIQLYALRHFSRIFFFEARRRAVVADGGTFQAQVDAALEIVVIHGSFFLMSQGS